MTAMDAEVAAELQRLRHSIDNMDAALVHLLAERFAITQQVGVLKAAYGLPPADPAREAQQIARLRALAEEAQLDPDAGPLIAVKLHILTRKTLGGLQTDLEGRVLAAGGEPLPGLFAAGEVAGFGGGGMHGYRALEGTFLGGCLFSGRVAGRALAAQSRT